METQEKNKIQTFKDLVAWKEGHQLVLFVYSLTKKFPKDELFGLVNQMRRCAVSITSNIAEGFSRQSFKEKIQFFCISQGSVTELQNQLTISKDVGYISAPEFSEAEQQSIRVHKILNGLIKRSRNFLILFILLIPTSLFLIPSFAEAGVIRRAPNNLSLVGYWSFDDGAGTKATDMSGNGNTGTLTAGPTWVNGPRGKAVSFDGTDDYVLIPDASLASGSNITLSLWFNQTSSKYVGLFASAAASDAPGEFAMLINANGTVTFTPWIVAGGERPHLDATSAGAVSYGTWHHAVGVYDVSTGYAYIYIDGVLAGSTNTTVTYSTWNGPAIGSGGVGGTTTYFTNGKIDDVRLYNRALTAAQILALYNSGQTTRKVADNRGLVGHWPFDDASGSKATDASGSGYTGTLTGANGLPTWVSGRRGKALSFDDVDDYVNVGDQDGLDFGTSDFTLVAWMKNPGSGLIVSKYSGGAGYDWRVESILSYLVVQDSGGGTEAANTGGVNLNDGAWHHVVVTADRDGVATHYVDGVVSGSTTSIATRTGSLNNSDSFYIGLRSNGIGPIGGYIDDVRAYNRALTAAEIATLYNSGSATLSASQNSKYTNGLIGLWTFNGPDIESGVIKDRSGNGNDANAFSIATSSFYDIGKLGQGANFDGTDDYLNVTNTNIISSLSGQKISVFAWVKPNLVVKNNLLSFQGNPNFFIHEGRTPYFRELSYWDSTVAWQHGNTALTMGDWTHIGYTLDGTALTFYVNGVADGTATTATFNLTGYTTIRIGLANGAEYGSGGIDEMRIYNRILSASEAKQLYDMGR